MADVAFHILVYFKASPCKHKTLKVSYKIFTPFLIFFAIKVLYKPFNKEVFTRVSFHPVDK